MGRDFVNEGEKAGLQAGFLNRRRELAIG